MNNNARNNSGANRNVSATPQKNVRPANSGTPVRKTSNTQKGAPKAPKKQVYNAEYEAKLREYRKNMMLFYAKLASYAVIIAIILALVLFGMISCSFFVDLNGGGSENYIYSVELLKDSEDEDNEMTVLDNNTVYKNGGVYIPLSAMKEYSSYTLAGDSESRSVIFGSTGGAFSDGDSAEFLIGSNCVRVNKNRVTLEHPVIASGDELYIPYDFFKLYVSGFDFTEEIKGSKAIYRVVPNGELVGFRLAENAAEYPPIETEYFPDALPDNAFTVDLTAYEEYMTPENGEKYLVLANNKSRLSADYNPGELINVFTTTEGRSGQQLEKSAAMALEAMLKEASAQGFKDLAVYTGFRSYSTQKSIYDPRFEANRANAANDAEAEEMTVKSVSYPGASDHQTGFGFDLHNLSSNDIAFAESAAYQWLITHCADFGFILRYPESKVEITGVDFEPWHFRFVGRFHAQSIMKQGLCLEEYVQTLATE